MQYSLTQAVSVAILCCAPIVANALTYFDCVNRDGSMAYRTDPCRPDQKEKRHFEVELEGNNAKQNVVKEHKSLSKISASQKNINQSISSSANTQQAELIVERAKERLDSYRGLSSDLDLAKADIDSAFALNSRFPPAYKELARFHIMGGYINRRNFRPGSLEAAENALKKAVEIDPNYVGAYVLFGHLYRNMNRPQDARAALTKADKLGTNDPWLQLNWADILIDDGRLDEASLRYKKVIESGTDNKKAMVSAFSGLIEYNRQQKKFGEVETLYERQIAYEPSNAWSYGNYANFLLCAEDKFNAAIPQARKALTIMNYGMGRFELGSALYRKWAQAVEDGKTREESHSIFVEARGIYPNLGDVIANASRCPPMSRVQAAILANPQP